MASFSFKIWLTRLPYILFSGLFLFETLNFFRILPHSAEFGWRGRFISTAGVFLVLYTLQYLFRRKLKKELPAILWILGGVLLLVDFLGDVYFLYGRWPWYDQAAHFLSGPLIVGAFLIVFSRLSRGLEWRHPFSLIYLLSLGISVICATLYEIEEYLEDVVFSAHRLGDGPDTVNDILLNFLGGVAAIAAVALYRFLSGRAKVADSSAR